MCSVGAGERFSSAVDCLPGADPGFGTECMAALPDLPGVRFPEENPVLRMRCGKRSFLYLHLRKRAVGARLPADLNP